MEDSRMAKVIDHESIARQLKRDYSFAIKDQTARALNGIQSICAHLEHKELDIHAFLNEAANMISRVFAIREIAIGLKSSGNGLFRYEVIVGSREDAEKALRRLVYTLDDFGENSRYKGRRISKYSVLFLAEDSPYSDGEKDSYSRQILLGSKRKSMTESLEEDYLDVYMYGIGDELLGWIEISGTRTGNLPDATTIKWIELISKIIGTALSYANSRRGYLGGT
jgi:hypothetical protein